MKVADQLQKYRDKDDDDLRAELRAHREELFKLRFRRVTDVIEDTARLGWLRRSMARIKTILAARELGLEKVGSQPQRQMQPSPGRKKPSPEVSTGNEADFERKE